MERNLRQLKLDLDTESDSSSPPEEDENEVLEWDWDIEHADRKAEAKADAALHGALPFEVDRKVLKDVVREKMGAEVVRIKFLSAGTFHKAYLVTLADRQQVVARVARRFMPRLKTESEVATMQYLREHTAIPVPLVYHYDSNPYNRLGGEFIIMSKARGIPLSKVYHSLSYNNLVKLLTNLAELVIPLFAHRFPQLGSLYFGPNPHANADATAPTPKAVQMHYSAFPFSPTLPLSPLPSAKPSRQNSAHGVPKFVSRQEYHVGPIISWPFFGSNRGDLVHPNEINRGPWSTTQSYLESCVQREVDGVIRENEGKAAPHKLHLDPDEILSSRRHHLKAVPGDESDDSDEWNLEESEEEWEGPGDVMYRDYRRMQRSTFLIAHTRERELCVKKEMARWLNLMERLLKHERELRGVPQSQVSLPEEFGLDCHDLSLENVFVDEVEHHRITCIIDWESTTTRPLWACAHLPAFLQFSPFTGKLFRDIVARMASSTSTTVSSSSTPTSRHGFHQQQSQHLTTQDKASLAREWLQYEASGMRLRMAHRFIEWDGWEEGLAESTLGEEENEEGWFADINHYDSNFTSPPMTGNGSVFGIDLRAEGQQSLGSVAEVVGFKDGPSGSGAGPGGGGGGGNAEKGEGESILGSPLTRRKPTSKLIKLPFVAELEKEQMLDTTGDICGGRGGELGRRLEAWLSVNGHETNTSAPIDGPRRRWHNDDVDGVESGEVL
ncbi:hypothetical protein EV361DRAFT_878494 [Lentinula raphanica]|uniref:Aminoglycoside phosphotransferase domain-containing protein n=1 Tax=Lentinula raphanica TaxID=153919 RepID=A0AA38P0A8_9AGAR|nr:hypothetical protein F5880DRAFT_1471125 [Lentinula raphanica]KAJ3833796.1 hypothetical protein F5878DRAFT_388257 [Lentinula raphanica]KAJ3977447.1 hypothetical protein EV361DRAFT_878494 [Lentinula raphanica]